MAKKTKVETLQEQMQEKWQEIDGIRQKVVGEEREFTEDERDQVEKGLDEIKEVEDELDEARKDQDLKDRIKEYGEGLETSSNGSPNGQGRKANRRNGDGMTLGQRFINSEPWQKWLDSVAPSGRIPDSKRGLSSPPVEVKDFGIFEKKDLLTGEDDASAGAFVESERTGIYEPLGRFPLQVRDLISVRQTTSDAVEFVRQLTQVQQAAAVQEANVTTPSGATGEITGEKPEASMTFERVSETVKTLAVWIPATKRALSDASQLRGIIDQELRSDLNEELEDQILTGDGTGDNLTGLANTANVLAQAFDTDLIVTTRKAITNLLVNGKQMPTAWLFSPQDWEAFDLLKDDQGRYYWGGPMARGPRTLWGVPVAQSFFQTQGVGWLANWTKAVIWDREDGNISVSDSHEDFFIRNMVAVLAELRAAFGIIRPSAFVEVDLLSGS